MSDGSINSSDESPDVDVAELLWVAARAFLRALGAHDSLPTAQLAVLRELADSGPSSFKALAEKEQVKRQSMAGTVLALKEQGLVSVEANPADRRWSIVSITKNGNDGLISEQSKHRDLVVAAAANGLNEEECTVLDRVPDLLIKLSRALPAADDLRMPGFKPVPLGSASGRH